MCFRLTSGCLWILISLITSTLSYAQDNKPPIDNKPEIKEDDQDLKSATHELTKKWFDSFGGFLKQCGIVDVGRFRFGEARVRGENDIISQDDQNYTHGLSVLAILYGTLGKIWASYETKLWSLDTQDGFTPPQNYGAKPGALANGTANKTFFYELTDFRLKVESALSWLTNGFYRVGVGIQYFGNTKNIWGGAAQQRGFHALPIQGSENNDYVYGDIRDLGATVSADIGMTFQSQNGRFYCRPEIGVELSTNTDLSFIQASAEAGVVVCQDEKGRAVAELVSKFKCTQYASGDRETQASLDARWNIIRGKEWEFGLECGVLALLEQADGLFHFTEDKDAILRAQLCLARRF